MRRMGKKTVPPQRSYVGAILLVGVGSAVMIGAALRSEALVTAALGGPKPEKRVVLFHNDHPTVEDRGLLTALIKDSTGD